MRPIDVARSYQGIPATDRFAASFVVDPVTECFVWTGSLDSHGYGRLTVDGRHMQAHRYALVLSGVELVSGHQVRHRCGNRACVNADHLQQVTRSRNQAMRGRSPRNDQESEI